MSRLNVLVAPTVDYDLANTLASLGAGIPNIKPAFTKGQQLHRGDTVYNSAAYNLSERSILTTLFGLRSRIDLDVKAPVNGMYYPPTFDQHFYGNSQDQNAYSYESARKKNQPPENMEEIKQFGKQCSFVVLTHETPDISGQRVFANYFDQLKSNREKLTEWIELRDETYIDTDFFWRSVYAEEARLSEIKCPVIPYDEQTFG